MGQLAQVAQGARLRAATPARTVADYIGRDDVQTAIKAVIPRSLTPERLTQICISAINQTPRLAECSVESILSCVMKCSQVGLEPSNVNGLGLCYILPYRSRSGMQAQFILGYKGIIKLALQSGYVTSIKAQAVYEGDEFASWEDETGQHFRFVADLDAEHSEKTLRLVYCVAQLKAGGFVFEQMRKGDVDAIRARSKASTSGPWVTDYEQMALKTVIKRTAKYLPLGTTEQSAVQADETTPDYSDGLRLPAPVGDSMAEIQADGAAQVVDTGTGEIVAGTDDAASEKAGSFDAYVDERMGD